MNNPHQDTAIISVQPLSSPMPGKDPFIFGAYHQDHYPKGNGKLGPDKALLRDRDLGMDFSGNAGWSMYHGNEIPGFPAHPHRDFETVTIVRKGLVDHADSLGATARYGEGDVQWLTTGAGIQHGEMFPLVHQDKENTLDLFQIWLNLPAKNKMAPPNFTMFWAHQIPHYINRDEHGRCARVEIIAGDFHAVEQHAVIKALAPPTHSWANDANAHVAIWIIQLDAGANLQLPKAHHDAGRLLYLTSGAGVNVNQEAFCKRVMIELKPDAEVVIHNPLDTPIELLLLQGKPIGEPMAARGPFVMNSQDELIQAMNEYHRTEFGGWPWPSRAHTHGTEDRFAQYPDGQREVPPPPPPLP